MSSSAEGSGCRKCGEPIEGTPWLFAWGTTLLTLGFLPINLGPLCAGCKARYDFLGVLMLVAMLAIAFVLAVILLG